MSTSGAAWTLSATPFDQVRLMEGVMFFEHMIAKEFAEEAATEAWNGATIINAACCQAKGQ